MDRRSPPNILTLVLLAALGALSMNVFIPALPEMTSDFNTDYAVMQLSVSAYLAVNAGLQILVGPLSDKYGRRPLTLIGVALFTLATLGCIYAPNVEVFLFFRMVQAVVAFAIVLSRAIVRDIYPADRAAAMLGYVAMGMSLVPMVSPLIGGILTNLYDWTSTFWLMFGMGIFTLVLVWFDQGETNLPRPVTLAAQFRQYPLLLRSGRFWGYALAIALSIGAFYIFLGGAPFISDEIFNLSPAVMGMWFGMPAVGYLIGNFISGLYAARLGINRMVLYGTYIACLGVALILGLALMGIATPATFFATTGFVGIANGMVIPSATAGALSVRPDLAGTAAGLSGALQIGGGAALAAMGGALVSPALGLYTILGLMLAISIASTIAILLVMRSERY
ncbi:MAG: multidrug effflux MFS transporter [Paracoccaceae bacterium]